MPISHRRIIVEGHAIVSEDGMIADAHGEMPPGLRNEADWRLFQAALDRAAMVVLGRLGHARHPNSGRRRLVLSRQAPDISPDPNDPMATFWNPAGISIEAVLDRLGVAEGVLAVAGGRGLSTSSLPLYDRFVLAEVRGLQIPEGTPCFSEGLPQPMLRNAGMIAGEPAAIDSGVVQTTWRRPLSGL